MARLYVYCQDELVAELEAKEEELVEKIKRAFLRDDTVTHILVVSGGGRAVNIRRRDVVPVELSERGKVFELATNEQLKKIERLDLSGFRHMVLIKDFISVVGSSVDKQVKEPRDLDVVVRFDPRTGGDYLRRAIYTRLYKINPKVHVIFEPMGSSDDYVPLYDLMLVRVNPEKKLVEMQVTELKEKHCDVFVPFKPMKPKRRFYDLDQLLDYLFPE